MSVALQRLLSMQYHLTALRKWYEASVNKNHMCTTPLLRLLLMSWFLKYISFILYLEPKRVTSHQWCPSLQQKIQLGKATVLASGMKLVDQLSEVPQTQPASKVLWKKKGILATERFQWLQNTILTNHTCLEEKKTHTHTKTHNKVNKHLPKKTLFCIPNHSISFLLKGSPTHYKLPDVSSSSFLLPQHFLCKWQYCRLGTTEHQWHTTLDALCIWYWNS